MEQISGWMFDFTSPVHLLHPNNKFWQATLNGLSVKFRVGKIKDGAQNSTEQVEKDYPTHVTAKNSVVSKTEQKLTKGYYPKNGKKANQKQEKKKQQAEKKDPEKKSQKNSKVFTGQFYEKGSEGIRIQVRGTQVKITRIDQSGRQKFQVRSMSNSDEAVEFCLKQQQWILGQNYKPNHKKFSSSMIDEQPKKQSEKSTRKKGEKDSNFLSVIQMTDDAISHRSRNASETKSDRSYVDSGPGGQKYLPSKLGDPTSNCIKVLLAETWSDDVDPKGWVMSEKLDGVRMFWTGTTMYSRNGNRFFFPKFFTKNWPNSQMDGELFIGRGQFSKTLSAVKKNNPIDDEWAKVNYLVFDCPGLKKPFKGRIKTMQEVIKAIDNPYLKCHGHRQCKGYQDLFEQLDRVNKIEGEGLMLRDPDSFYQNRRSKSLLKVKTFHDDEATVLGYTEGTGRCYGMAGALKVRNTHGIQFEVGSGMTDAIRRKPPKIGTKITYKYQEFIKTSGKPRFPTFLRAYDHI